MQLGRYVSCIVSTDSENGETRSQLVVSKQGPGLNLLDEKGETRAMLVSLKGGPMLTLSDENGKTRSRLAVDKDVSMLYLSDEGNPRVMLNTSKDGTGLRLYGPDRTMIWSAP